MRKDLTRIVVKGGVLSPSELTYICDSAEKLGLKTISFGARQDIMFPVEIKREQLEPYSKIQTLTPHESAVENIISSYVTAGIFSSTPWVTGDLYLNLLEQFRYLPTLKINIVDPKQKIVPLFNGHLNFICSPHEDYWYLYIRLPNWSQIQLYPALIFSWDIAAIAKEIENILIEEIQSVDLLFEILNETIITNNRTIDQELSIPFELFPYYEGMHRMGNDEYWLGLYWRNNQYDTAFLKAMCELCGVGKIGKISITPWKSFIVKGIPASQKLNWEKLLGKFGINARHSMLELNWHLPVNHAEALKLKKYLVTNFDQNDISTYGLTFAIIDYTLRYFYYTSIVIEINPVPEIVSNFDIRKTYNLLYARDFDPNTRHYISYVKDVDIVELPGLLMELSQLYFEQLGQSNESSPVQNNKSEIKKSLVYQCPNCGTIYDEKAGDFSQNILPNTPFDALPNHYQCNLCETSKLKFQPKEIVLMV